MSLIVADESVDFRIVKALRNTGFDVIAIVEENPSIEDTDVLALAVKLNAIVLTEDKDFGELVYRLKLPHFGIFLLRLHELDADLRPTYVARVFSENSEKLPNKFSVLDTSRLRSR